MRSIALIITSIITWGMAGNAAGQTMVPLGNPAQIRDLARDVSSGRLYAAAYDLDQVLILDPLTGQTAGQIAVGQGPCALAISAEGSTLACVNRLDSSLSLIRLPEAAVYATLKTGEGPSRIVPLPDGRFAITNTYSDSITLVNPKNNGETETITDTLSVPTGIAVSEDYVLIIGRAETCVALYPISLQGAMTKIEIDTIPTAVTALTKNQFAVVASTGLFIIDAASQRIGHRLSGSFTDIAWDGASLWSLKGNTIQAFDSALTPQKKISAPENSQRIVCAGDILTALSPAAKTGYLLRPDEIQAPQAPPVAEETVAEASPSISPESTPTPADDTAKETPAVVEASEAAASAAPQTVETPREMAETTPATAPETTPEESVSPPSDDVKPPSPQEPIQTAQQSPADITANRVSNAMTVRQYLPVWGTRAPHPGKTSSVLLQQVSQKTISEAVTQPTEFGDVGSGFVAPDWTQPFRDVKAGHAHQDLDTGRTELQNNVHLRLGDMYFRSDAFSYAEDFGEMMAQGNVCIDQQTSKITADKIEYQTPPDAAVPPPSIFEPPRDDQGQARKRLTLGHIYAQNIHIIEPTREFVAENVDYDFANSSGELINARGKAGLYYFYAQKLRISGPNSMEGEDVWISTCDHNPPHYRVRLKSLTIKDGVATGGKNVRLQLGKATTPLFLPFWRSGNAEGQAWNFDFSSGRLAEIGSYINVGQRFEVNPNVALGPRIMPTTKAGVGLGADLDYNFMENPESRLYRTRGEVHGLYTTEDRGYVHLTHRFEPSKDLTVRAQLEHWGDEDFYKDFFYEEYRNRTTPRTFVNTTYRQPGYIATGTVRVDTHGWVRETERLPEGTFHLLERPITDNLFLTFDTINGYNRREPSGDHAVRSVNVVRLSYDWDPVQALNITPFLETQAAWYSDRPEDGGSASRLTETAGVTLQTRLHREYAGHWGFSAFKHVVLPSITYSYRPSSSMDMDETYHFDALDSFWGRSRIEAKIDNVLYGRDAETGQVWQVGRLTLYQGNDFWNETRGSDDYEIEIDVRPRPWWGWQFMGERHVVNHDLNLDSPDYFQNRFYEWYDHAFGRPFDPDGIYDLNASYGDYNRVLTQLYYDDTMKNGRLKGRIGFAYTETQDRVFNRGILYGAGYKLGEKWGVGFEHIYDFEDNALRQQIYELRRSLHCWEAAIRWRERESGSDINLEFSISAFPGSRLKL